MGYCFYTLNSYYPIFEEIIKMPVIKEKQLEFRKWILIVKAWVSPLMDSGLDCFRERQYSRVSFH